MIKGRVVKKFRNVNFLKVVFKIHFKLFGVILDKLIFR